jgi:hypothetical protein
MEGGANVLPAVEAAARALGVPWDHVTLMGYNAVMAAWLEERHHLAETKRKSRSNGRAPGGE